MKTGIVHVTVFVSSEHVPPGPVRVTVAFFGILTPEMVFVAESPLLPVMDI